MGLTPANVDARSSSARRSVFSCDSLSDAVLLAPGFPPASGSRENLLTDGAVISVSEGQCAILVSRGRVFDLCAEPGAYAYGGSTPPEPLPGELGEEALKNLYPYSPDTSGNRLFYVHTRPVSPVFFSSGRGVPFRIVIPASRLDLDVMLFCEGSFRYRICDPVRFFTEITGPVKEPFRSGELNERLAREAETVLPPVLAEISAENTAFSSKQAFCRTIAERAAERLADHWEERLGVRITELTIDHVRSDGAARRYFDDWLAAGEQPDPRPPAAPAPKTWYCPECGAASAGNFCPQCGRRRP